MQTNHPMHSFLRSRRESDPSVRCGLQQEGSCVGRRGRRRWMKRFLFWICGATADIEPGSCAVPLRCDRTASHADPPSPPCFDRTALSYNSPPIPILSTEPTYDPLMPTTLCRYDMLTMLNTHIFKPRDISVASASSFIIVVSVGFIGLLLVCVGTSTHYRRRFTRNQAPLLATEETEDHRTPPQLWDVSLSEIQYGLISLSGADWEHVQVSIVAQ